MDWEEGASWMSLGCFRDDATFVFDKQRIAEQLSSNLSDAAACPHLNREYVRKAFECLPSRAGIWGRWRYREANAGDAGAVTVKVTRYVHGCAISANATVNGVDPEGTREALKIVRKAAKLSGRASGIRDLLSILRETR